MDSHHHLNMKKKHCANFQSLVSFWEQYAEKEKEYYTSVLSSAQLARGADSCASTSQQLAADHCRLSQTAAPVVRPCPYNLRTRPTVKVDSHAQDKLGTTTNSKTRPECDDFEGLIDLDYIGVYGEGDSGGLPPEGDLFAGGGASAHNDESSSCSGSEMSGVVESLDGLPVRRTPWSHLQWDAEGSSGEVGAGERGSGAVGAAAGLLQQPTLHECRARNVAAAAGDDAVSEVSGVCPDQCINPDMLRAWQCNERVRREGETSRHERGERDATTTPSPRSLPSVELLSAAGDDDDQRIFDIIVLSSTSAHSDDSSSSSTSESSGPNLGQQQEEYEKTAGRPPHHNPATANCVSSASELMHSMADSDSSRESGPIQLPCDQLDKAATSSDKLRHYRLNKFFSSHNFYSKDK